MLTVVCKATFALRPGQSAALASPDVPATADIPWHRETQCIGVPSDLVPFKRNVDVLLIGHAYAPQRRPVSSLITGFSIANLSKTILVTGDRSWEPNGACPEPEPFVRIPLSWDRAAGGPSTWNPVGLPVGARIDPRTRPRIPNLLPRGFVLQNSNHLIPPVGFGAIAPHWPSRAAYVQKWANTWNHAKWYESLLPQDLDAVYFNSASGDQQLRELPETTQLTLDYLHPDVPRLTTVIEDIRPRATVTRTSAPGSQELWLRADTLLIDADRCTCSITWRATLALRHPQEEGVVHIEPTRGAAAASSAAKSSVGLPFQPSPSPSVPPPSVAPSSATNSIPSSRPSAPDNLRRDNPLMAMSVDEFTTLPLRAETPNSGPAMPFRPPSPSSPPGVLPFAPPPAARRESPSVASFGDDSTMVRKGEDKPVETSALPFKPSSPSQLNLRPNHDDEVTTVHAKLIPKPAPADDDEDPPTPVPKKAPPQSFVRPGKTLIPGIQTSKEPALPFRPVAQAPEDPAVTRNRLAAMNASSVLPFQAPNTRSDVPPPRDSVPNVPPTSAFTIPVPSAGNPPNPPARSAPSSSLTALPAALAPLGTSGLPFQSLPSTDNPAPPPVRDRLPSVPPSGAIFGAPLGAATPPPPPSAPSLGASGLPFQTPASSDSPPRERMPSVPPTDLPFVAAGGVAPAPPMSPSLATSGLPFQTSGLGEAPPVRDRLPSVPAATPFAAPAVPTTSSLPPIPSPTDAPRPMQWSRLSGPSDEIKPTLSMTKSDVATPVKAKGELSFERYAQIKVHLWSSNAPREDVLSKHGIDEIDWHILEQQQTEALESEAKEGKCDLALALVAAFEAANSPSLSAP